MPKQKTGTCKKELKSLLGFSFTPKDCSTCSRLRVESVEELIEKADSWAFVVSEFNDQGEDFGVLMVFRHNGEDSHHHWEVLYQAYRPGCHD